MTGWKSLPPVRFIRRHPGFVLFIVVGALSALVFDALIGPTAPMLIYSWTAAAAANLAFLWYRMATFSLSRIRRRAAEIDMADSSILGLSVLAALVSLGGIFLAMQGRSSWFGPVPAITAVIVSFAYVHTLFAAHYAHLFYSGRSPEPGLHFPEDKKEPVYADFLYTAFIIGVAVQTADVTITSTPMRRIALMHSVVSFFFNTTVLALAVNVGANLAQG